MVYVVMDRLKDLLTHVSLGSSMNSLEVQSLGSVLADNDVCDPPTFIFRATTWLITTPSPCSATMKMRIS